MSADESKPIARARTESRATSARAPKLLRDLRSRATDSGSGRATYPRCGWSTSRDRDRLLYWSPALSAPQCRQYRRDFPTLLFDYVEQLVGRARVDDSLAVWVHRLQVVHRRLDRVCLRLCLPRVLHQFVPLRFGRRDGALVAGRRPLQFPDPLLDRLGPCG